MTGWFTEKGAGMWSLEGETFFLLPVLAWRRWIGVPIFVGIGDSTKFEMIGTLMNWFHPCEPICSWNLWCSLSWSPRKPEQHGNTVRYCEVGVLFFVFPLKGVFIFVFHTLVHLCSRDPTWVFPPSHYQMANVENGGCLTKAILVLDSLELY